MWHDVVECGREGRWFRSALPFHETIDAMAVTIMAVAQLKRRRHYSILALFALTTKTIHAAVSHSQPQNDILGTRYASSFIGTRCCLRSECVGETNIFCRRWPSLPLYSQFDIRTSDTKSNAAINIIDTDEREFFISDAQFVRKCDPMEFRSAFVRTSQLMQLQFANITSQTSALQLEFLRRNSIPKRRTS